MSKKPPARTASHDDEKAHRPNPGPGTTTPRRSGPALPASASPRAVAATAGPKPDPFTREGKAAIRATLPEGPLRVRAIRMGIYADRRQKAGTVFTIKGKHEFSPRWMELAQGARETPIGERLTPATAASRIPATPPIDVPASDRIDDGDDDASDDEAFEAPPASSPESDK